MAEVAKQVERSVAGDELLSVIAGGQEFAMDIMCGRGIRGNFMDVATQEEYWVSGVKKRGSNTHWAESVAVKIDADALEAYREHRQT